MGNHLFYFAHTHTYTEGDPVTARLLVCLSLIQSHFCVSFACVAFAVSFFPSIVHFLLGNEFFSFRSFFFCFVYEIGENVAMMKLLDIREHWALVICAYMEWL